MKQWIGLGCILFAIAIIIAGCQPQQTTVTPPTFSSVSVTSSYDPQTVFPKGSGFAFVTLATETTGDLAPELATFRQRMQHAIQNELIGKGFVFGDLDNTRFLINYNLVLQQDYHILAAQPHLEDEDWAAVMVIRDDYVQGALIVQIIDGETMEPVWLGAFNADILPATVSEDEKVNRIRYAAAELFKNFPPK